MNWSVGAGTIGYLVCEGVRNSYNYLVNKENVNGSMLAGFERTGGASTHCVGCP